MNRILALVLGSCLIVASLAQAADHPLPPGLIALTDRRGQALLLKAEGRRSFIPLLSNFVSQDTDTFCGAASSVIVLNALGLPAPVDPGHPPYRYFTQSNLFSSRTEAVVARGSVERCGMTLDRLAALLRTHGAATRVVHADESSVSAFREGMRLALSRDSTFIVLNFTGIPLGLTESGGHFSPIGAYDAKGDRILVLDVARFIYPPYWVKTAELFAAMNTPDSDNANRVRGYVVVTRPATSTPNGNAAGAR